MHANDAPALQVQTHIALSTSNLGRLSGRLILLTRQIVNCLSDGSPLGLEYQKCDPHKERHQNEAAVDHVPEERRHLDPSLLRNSFHHEVRSVPNVAIGAHKDGPQADSLQPDVRHASHSRTAERETRLRPCGFEKRHVGWGIIKEGGEGTREPKKPGWGLDSQGRPMLL